MRRAAGGVRRLMNCKSMPSIISALSRADLLVVLLRVLEVLPIPCVLDKVCTSCVHVGVCDTALALLHFETPVDAHPHAIKKTRHQRYILTYESAQAVTYLSSGLIDLMCVIDIFFPGCGHAGQSNARAPGGVTSDPAGS
jgi:hypothetical protein